MAPADLKLNWSSGGQISLQGVPFGFATVADLKELLSDDLLLEECPSTLVIAKESVFSGFSNSDSELLSNLLTGDEALRVLGTDIPCAAISRPWFPPGCDVIVQGLEDQSESGLTGCPGRVHHWDSSRGEYEVQIILTKSFKADNLRRMRQGEESPRLRPHDYLSSWEAESEGFSPKARTRSGDSGKEDAGTCSDGQEAPAPRSQQNELPCSIEQEAPWTPKRMRARFADSLDGPQQEGSGDCGIEQRFGNRQQIQNGNPSADQEARAGNGSIGSGKGKPPEFWRVLDAKVGTVYRKPTQKATVVDTLLPKTCVLVAEQRRDWVRLHAAQGYAPEPAFMNIATLEKLDVQTWRVATQDKVEVYEEPSFSAKVLGVKSPGTLVKVIFRQNDWARVYIGNRGAWIPIALLKHEGELSKKVMCKTDSPKKVVVRAPSPGTPTPSHRKESPVRPSREEQPAAPHRQESPIWPSHGKEPPERPSREEQPTPSHRKASPVRPSRQEQRNDVSRYSFGPQSFGLGWLLWPLPSGTSSSSPAEAAAAAAFHDMPAARLREIVGCMITLYSTPEFQSLLVNLGSNPKAQVEQLRKLVAPVQFSLLQHMRLPTGPPGAAALQNAVHRHVYKGDMDLKRLANASLEALRVAPFRVLSHEMTAADVFADVDDKLGTIRHAEITDMRMSMVAGSAEHNALAPVDMLRKQLRPQGPISLGMMHVWSLWEQTGLPSEFRTRPTEPGNISVVYLHRPSAKELFAHVLQNRPVVIKGALQEQQFPPLRDFAQLSYLRRRCGSRRVRVAGDLCQDRAGHCIFMSDPSVEMSFSEYLESVEEAEAAEGPARAAFYMCKMPLKQQLPELAEDAERSPGSPMACFGECFGPDQKGIHMHFGYGGTSSGIHFDPSENFVAVISGTKRFDLYPPYDVDCLYPSKPPTYVNSAVPPFMSPGEMPEDARARWPLYRHTDPQRVDLVAGDLLYLPIFWWHGVSGGKERSLTLNWWCKMHPNKAAPSGQGALATEVLESLRKCCEK